MAELALAQVRVEIRLNRVYIPWIASEPEVGSNGSTSAAAEVRLPGRNRIYDVSQRIGLTWPRAGCPAGAGPPIAPVAGTDIVRRIGDRQHASYRLVTEFAATATGIVSETKDADATAARLPSADSVSGGMAVLM